MGQIHPISTCTEGKSANFSKYGFFLGHTRPSSHGFFFVRPISVHFPSIMESAPSTRAAGPIVPLLLVGVAWPEAGLEPALGPFLLVGVAWPEAGLEPGLEPARPGGERLSLADACLEKDTP